MANILIIGAGVSGLSAGIYAELSGHHAIVCEKHFVPGGNLTAWERDGYHIDNCIHWLTGTNPATQGYKMWEELGVLGDTEIYRAEKLYTCERNGQTLSLYRDIDRMEREMLELSPGDAKEVRRLIRAIDVIRGFQGTAGKNKRGKLDLVKLLRSAPDLIMYYGLTTGELTEKFEHPLLKNFMTALWGEEFGVLALLFVFATFTGDDGDLPRGGSSAMAERLTSRLKELGGELHLNKEAVKVNIEDKRARSVTFKDGETIAADFIVLAAEPTAEFGRIVDLPMPAQLAENYSDKRLLRFSSYHCAFACDLAELPFSGDFIFEIPETYRDIVHSNQFVIREFSHEPGFSPEGKNIILTHTYLYEDDARALIELRAKDREGYKAKKKELADVSKRLIEDKLPQLKGRLTCIDVWTPATYNRYTNAEVGSYMSFILPPNVFPQKIRSEVDGIKNLYLATQWQQIPGGLPIAAESGKRAIKAICRVAPATRRRTVRKGTYGAYPHRKIRAK